MNAPAAALPVAFSCRVMSGFMRRCAGRMRLAAAPFCPTNVPPQDADPHDACVTGAGIGASAVSCRTGTAAAAGRRAVIESTSPGAAAMPCFPALQ